MASLAASSRSRMTGCSAMSSRSSIFSEYSIRVNPALQPLRKTVRSLQGVQARQDGVPGIPSQWNVGVEVWDCTKLPIRSLLHNSLEIHIHSFLHERKGPIKLCLRESIDKRTMKRSAHRGPMVSNIRVQKLRNTGTSAGHLIANTVRTHL